MHRRPSVSSRWLALGPPATASGTCSSGSTSSPQAACWCAHSMLCTTAPSTGTSPTTSSRYPPPPRFPPSSRFSPGTSSRYPLPLCQGDHSLQCLEHHSPLNWKQPGDFVPVPTTPPPPTPPPAPVPLAGPSKGFSLAILPPHFSPLPVCQGDHSVRCHASKLLQLGPAR